MKRTTIYLLICTSWLMLIGTCTAASAGESYQDQFDSTSTKAVSTHAISLQFLGLDYGYEQKLGGSFSMIFRAGIVPAGFSMFNFYNSMGLQCTFTPGISIEPRYYTNFKRRVSLGKSTYKNSGDFVAIKIQGDLRPDISFTPMYGIRRVWGRHWFGEFTVGARIGIADGGYISPYVQYRFGFVF